MNKAMIAVIPVPELTTLARNNGAISIMKKQLPPIPDSMTNAAIKVKKTADIQLASK